MVEQVSSEKLSQLVVEGMLEKKGKDIVIMDLREAKGAIADFFVVCSGSSETQIDSLGKSIEDAVYKSHKENPKNIEGRQNKSWVLIDFVNVVAHILKKDSREFYGLEELWGDAKITRIEDSFDD